MNEETKEDNRKDKEYWEARQNLFGFFSLLLEVDKRVNPQLYKKPAESMKAKNKQNV